MYFFTISVVSVRLVLPPGENVNISEAGGSITVCAEIESGSLADGETATVTLATADGTAEREL